MTKMTREEEFKIIQKIRELDAEGKHEEAHKEREKLPLAPHLIEAGRVSMGDKDFFSSGFNLSEAGPEIIKAGRKAIGDQLFFEKHPGLSELTK
ncbi:hypothetical protein [Maridesulfovibrio hydrothermalis]|uniref:Uncharacterized protein n=1 Tax=Maridesulfovibrio hydrothermalis AM13 = DSM 14728 TaxID=1121451 RepID=L0R5M8_9BACT|nr:hypothetical protein [Maridesulfovibrio hydrothermalis]CCO21983.1 protein of unknown function [Maridesulfovibrio hydrothermalis AM13 = DSM 14728]